jgi:hypothetical protein
MKQYLYKLLARYIGVFIGSQDSIIEINPKNNWLKKLIHNDLYSDVSISTAEDWKKLECKKADYYLLNGNLHFETDIQDFLIELHRRVEAESRVIVCFYSGLWRPLIKLATKLRVRESYPEQNWISPTDLANFCQLSGFEIINRNAKILFPLNIPILSYFINRWIAPLPVIRSFNLVNIAMLRPVIKELWDYQPSVSIVVPARNEAGNIENIIKRIPKMGPKDELIFIEGNSTDNTWTEIKRLSDIYKGQINIKIDQQDGKGKGDAVRKGFHIAQNEILMILDADLTVPPEDLPKFYDAILYGKGEFINGSRLVYPMEKEAMRFFNIIGNKFFANAFTFVLNQSLKDTLCGTKVLTASNYKKIASNRSYFGNFDPFGDFDLLFGASRLGLKIIELPIKYRARTYGDTNIQRWKHGVVLLRMLVFSAQKLKFI